MDTAIYARLSMNRTGLSESVEFQTQDCIEYAAGQGWNVVGKFDDDDVSVSRYSKKEREGYETLLAAIRAGDVQAVLVTEISRLYRRLEDLIDLILLARDSSLRKIWTTNNRGFDLSTDEGIRNAVNAVYEAAEESRRISERVKRAKKNRAREGKFNGGRRPYGYEGPVFDQNGNITNRDSIGIAVVEEEALIIVRVADELLHGRSVRSVVHALNEEGIRTAAGNLWEPFSLKRVLLSPRLKGVRAHLGSEYPALWEPILDAEKWEQLSVLLKAEPRSRGAGKKGGRKYLLTGKAVCSLCGNPLIGAGMTRYKGGPVHRRYLCRRVDDAGRVTGCGSCGKISRAADPLDALVTEAVLYRWDSENLAEALAKASNSPSAEEVSDLLAKRAAEKAKLVEMAEAYAKNLMRLEQVTAATQIVEETIEAIERKIHRFTSNRILASMSVDATLREEWDRGDLDWRRSLLALIIERVVVHPCGRTEVRYRPRQDDPREWRFDPEKIEIVWKV